MQKRKVVLLGDSITQGLGSKKINFTEKLSELLGNDFIVRNMALTGTTILYARDIMSEIIAERPDYVVIVYGNVDAQIRPNQKGRIFPYIPKRFQHNGMLMPRPFYSRTWWKQAGQKVDNFLRHLFSQLIYMVDGSEQWVSLREFVSVYKAVIMELKKSGCQVIACSTVYIDEKKFPGSLNEYDNFNRALSDLSVKEKIRYLDIYSPLKSNVLKLGWGKIYCYDHFHPNMGGYLIIAERIANMIKNN